jgi:hypothetical protein
MMRRTLQGLFVGIAVMAAGAVSASSITFFERENFEGRRFSADQTVHNFARFGYNDRAESAIVENGAWEICVDAEFRGACAILRPGRYPDLHGFGNRVSSVRPVDDGQHHGRRRGDSGDAPRAILYEAPNLSGRSMAIEDETVTNLGGTRFNDRASSLRVLRGYWIFCSDARFQGECRTFGPGEYPTLPWGLDNRISSGRRIYNHYPYSHAPEWSRGMGPQSSLDHGFRTNSE